MPREIVGRRLIDVHELSINGGMSRMIGSALSIVVPILHLVIAWRYSDWRNWKRYYPTILFAIVVDLFTSIVTYTQSLWTFEKTIFIPNHTLTDLMIAFVILSTTVLIFLSNYPFKSKFIVQLGYLALWVAADSFIEFLFFKTNIVVYHNNWNFGWSVLLWGVMISVFRLHFTKPILAWLVCVGFAVWVICYFDISLIKLK